MTGFVPPSPLSPMPCLNQLSYLPNQPTCGGCVSVDGVGIAIGTYDDGVSVGVDVVTDAVGGVSVGGVGFGTHDADISVDVVTDADVGVVLMVLVSIHMMLC